MSIEQVKAELDAATAPVINAPTASQKTGWEELNTNPTFEAIGTIASWVENVALKAREIETQASMTQGAGQMAQSEYGRILTGADHPAADVIKDSTHEFIESAEVQVRSAAHTIEDLDEVLSALQTIDQKIGYIAGRITIGSEYADQTIMAQKSVVDAVNDYKASL